MAKDATGVLTAGPDTNLWLAPIGSVIPATVTTAFAGTWTNLGYLKDPPSIDRALTKTELLAWNAEEPLRTLLATDISSISLNIYQTNRETFTLYFGRLVFTTEGTGVSIEPDVSGDVERALCLELLDGANILRIFWRRCVVDSVGGISMDKADGISYNVTLKRLVPSSGENYKIQTNVLALVSA
jgi:hypothetical protein